MPSKTTSDNHIPEQVRRRGANARALLEAAKKAANPDAPQDPPADPPAPQDPPAAPPAPPAPPAPASDFEAKYNTLRGKYESEVPRMQEDLRSALLEINELKGRLSAAPASPTAPTPTSRIRPEEIDEFGPELTDYVRRLALDTLLPEVENLLAPLKATVKTASADSAEVRKERVFAYLDENVADWRKLNVDHSFLEWLAQPDELSGITRREILNDAFSRFDAVRVARIFHSFAPPAAVPPNPTPAPAPADFAAPSASRRASAPAGQPAKRTWKESEVKAFFRKSREGYYKGREKEADALRRDITAAGMEGRIQLGA